MYEDQIHIHPTAALAERVLLPGDPGRAMRLAQTLLLEPKMFNHNRGLWGYSGTARDGKPLTVQATGMGGPSAAIVISELIALGASRLMRVGTCGALDPGLRLGTAVLVSGVLCDDGTSRALSGCGRLELLTAGDPLPPGPLTTVTAVSTDLFYDAEPRYASWRDAGAQVVEMEAATLFALARLRNVSAGCVLLVSDLLGDLRSRIDPEALLNAEHELGELALQAV